MPYHDDLVESKLRKHKMGHDTCTANYNPKKASHSPSKLQQGIFTALRIEVRSLGVNKPQRYRYLEFPTDCREYRASICLHL